MSLTKYKIKLKQGDACKIKGLSDEQYHKVCKRFIDDGARTSFYNKHRRRKEDFVEWFKSSLCHCKRLEPTTKVYSYEEIMEEVSMNTFSKKDLKTGMIVVNEAGEIAMVLLGTNNGDIVSGETWYPLDELNNDLSRGWGMKSISEVWQSLYNMNYLNRWRKPNLSSSDYKLVWKRETPEQVKQRELREQYESTKKQLEDLGKQLGIEQ